MKITFKCPSCGKSIDGSERDLIMVVIGDEEQWAGVRCRCGVPMKPQHDSEWATLLINAAWSEAVMNAAVERYKTHIAAIMAALDDGAWRKKEKGGVNTTYWRRRLKDNGVLEFWPYLDLFRYTPEDEPVAGGEKFPNGARELITYASKGY